MKCKLSRNALQKTNKQTNWAEAKVKGLNDTNVTRSCELNKS